MNFGTAKDYEKEDAKLNKNYKNLVSKLDAAAIDKTTQ
jgi:uncharacterized protein YecT (DUF1311 family)